MKRDKQTAEIAERGTAALDKAVTTVTPYVEQAQAALAPRLDEAKVGLDVAKNTVQDTLLPRLNDMVQEAADAPATREAVKRSRTAAAALRGEIEVSDAALDKLAGKRAKQAAKRNAKLRQDFEHARKIVTDEIESAKQKVDKKNTKNAKKAKKGKFGKFLLITALLGVGAVVVKQLLAAKKDDPWQSYEPSTFSGPTSTPTPSPVNDTPKPSEPAEKPAAEAAAPAPAAADDAKYGAGSYIGTEPPAGYDIKGNDRSMKYHENGSDSYDRTIADVWFNSTGAAEAAGFTRAQR